MDKSTAKLLASLARGELDRALTSIHSPGHPRPFYLSYLIRDQESWRIQARFGSLEVDSHQRARNCFCDVRVGSYRNDQIQEGGLDDNSDEDESCGYVRLPFTNDGHGVRHALWRLTDSRYREAIEALATKKTHQLTYLDRNREFTSFEKLPPHSTMSWRTLPAVDVDYWSNLVKRASAMIQKHPTVNVSYVRLHAHNEVRVFVNSEGSQQIQGLPLWSLTAHLWTLTRDGDALEWNLQDFVADPSELPDLARFKKKLRDGIATLERLAKSQRIRSYSGPVLLDPEPAGLLIHEALGHRLEGDRMLSSGEGQTFRDAIGERILPAEIDIVDDPTLEFFDGRSLVGHYRCDDQGAVAKAARLVESGRLKDFLRSRAGISKRHGSNGHGRNERFQRPISRMAITSIEARDGLSPAAMKAKLIEEIERQGLPYGIRIIAASGGETATEAYNFQAFLGEINLATMVYPDGREEWIRGVDFVGTPLNATRSIIAAGKERRMDNSYCGAESGWVPISTISPSLLVSHLELQSKSEPPYTQYVYPMPWADGE